MANRPAAALGLREGDRAELARLTTSSTVRAGLAQRARIVLLAGDGESNTAIATKVGVSRPTVIGWRDRYTAHGIAGLDDDPRSGRPRTIDHRDIVAKTLKRPPKKYGVTHWSSRLLGRHLGISNGTIAKAWRDYGVAPWRVETFKFSTDPQLVGQVTDIVGLYLAPPDNAIVLCVDEKSQIQALDRTSTLFAALDIGTGTVTAACKPRHRHQEFLAFLKQIDRAYPDTEGGLQLHLVMDNYTTHKTVEIRAWLAAHPRFHVHFTPTSGSWLNLAEVWFGIIERQAIHRGSFGSVKDLNAKIRLFINGWNDRCHPFVWTKTAEDILKKANRQNTSNTRY